MGGGDDSSGVGVFGDGGRVSGWGLWGCEVC